MARTSTDSLSSRMSFTQWNRSLSIRNRNSAASSSTNSSRAKFSFASLRGQVQPELSRKLYRLIKSENNLITAYETAGRERVSIATQLSQWGEETGDDSISDISDKVGVVLSEIGEQEDTYAHALDDSRGILKTIRNIEKSVQPSRDNKAKIADDIAKLKLKEPESTKLVVLEQELVRAEAENLVAEAQLTNVTRQKLKESYNAEFLATIERAEKQIILARHGMRLLKLLDDTPVVPGDVRPAYEGGAQARQILNDAEDDLRDWRPDTYEDDAATTTTRQQQSSPGIGADGFAARAGQEQDAEYAKENTRPESTTTTSQGEQRIPSQTITPETSREGGSLGLSGKTESNVLQQVPQSSSNSEQRDTLVGKGLELPAAH